MDDKTGHRQRVRNRYLRIGLDEFEDYEALELLLFYAVPRRDTKALSKELLRKFGSLPEVLAASTESLMDAGLTENAALLLKLIPDLERRCAVLKQPTKPRIRSTADAGNLLCGLFMNEDEESIRMLCLNASGRVTKTILLGRGDVASVHFSVRKIVENALQNKAVSVILAHNHPSGSLTPSGEDIDATVEADAALKKVGIRLLDHIIVSDTNYCSLREQDFF